MANNRPINRRPWRRAPWRGKSRRPVRWVELNCSERGGLETCEVNSNVAVCNTPDPSLRTAGVLELWSGDFDAEYADDGNVVVERIVGDISLGGISLMGGGQFVVPYVRLGMLAVEEVESVATWDPPDLFAREDLEEFEWMWLYGTDFKGNWVPTLSGEATQGMRYGDTIHLDLRVKRKLGKKDSIVMIAQFGTLGPLVGSVNVGYFHTLRGLFSTK